MTKLELLEEIKETLQRDEDVSLEMKLEDIEEWDSLATISIISLYDELFETIVKTNDIDNCKTVTDLVNLVSDKLDS